MVVLGSKEIGCRWHVINVFDPGSPSIAKVNARFMVMVN